MATFEANSILHANTKTTQEPVRPLANFPPSIWGDRFLLFSVDTSELEAYVKAMEQPKEELRRLILNPTVGSNAKLSLIYSIHRLGLTYLFMEEIDGELDKRFNELNLLDYHQVDLHTTSIHFQVFRIHGYKFSCDVFNKFKDSSSVKFKEEIHTDVRGMLSLYEAAQLRIRGESILDDAVTFTKAQLISIEKTLDGNLLKQVNHALQRPLHRGMPLAEARLYFLNYEKECSTYGSLLNLATSHFKYLQLQQNQELHIVSKWWKDMNFQGITPYARDRVPESYGYLQYSWNPGRNQVQWSNFQIILNLSMKLY